MPYAEIEGLRLYYERAGLGDPELLFVPGWCCDGTAFQPQLEHFAPTNAVTALDLRGCGRSDHPADGYGIADLADDVTQFCRAVGIERPVVVGHSLGGMIAVELGGRRPPLPRALVLVDPGPIDWDPETVRFFDSLAEQLAGPGGEELRRGYVEDMGARDPALALWIADMMSAIPLPIATAVIRHLTEWDGAAAMARCDVPTLLMRADLDDETDVLRLLEIKPDLAIGVTVGAGHFHQLEVPDQVNAMIDRFLELAEA
ncbi:MAG TPA: alpha/beta hydrolase [Gaiellales bacterium]|nr:alpha/beta hydrolase [Gaiellales bacterium]